MKLKDAKETEMKQPYSFRISPEQPVPPAMPREFVAEVTGFINSSKPVDSDQTYTDFLEGLTEIIGRYASQLTADTPIYQERLPRIGHHEQTIATGWGGVFFREASEANDHVEKYLIVKQATDPFWVLGFEYHKKKIENLRIEEGQVLLMKANDSGSVSLTFAGPGESSEFNPPTAHGVIPLTNCTILETSNYELDAVDLLFIFRPVIPI